MTYDELQGLTYLQVKGTGLANTCPVVETGVSGGKIKAGDYALEKFCMEPTSFTVKEESSFKVRGAVHVCELERGVERD